MHQRRLQATTIKTNIRPKGRQKERQFSWIESWSDLVDDRTGQSLGCQRRREDTSACRS